MSAKGNIFHPFRGWFITGILLMLQIGACGRFSPGKTAAAGSTVKSPDSSAVAELHGIKNSINYGQDNPEEIQQNEKNIDDSRQDAITRAVKKVSPAVVSISVTEVVKEQQQEYNPFYNFFFPSEQLRKFKSLASGFIISSDGLIVTNQHVVGNNPSKVIVSLSDGHSYNAKIIGQDNYADIALLKINADKKLDYVTFGNSDKAIVGEWCIAMGNPFGLFDDGKPSVTVGVVSAVKRDFKPDPNQPRAYLDMIQTDAAINEGNSGGPLVNSLGQVIGINTFIYTGGTSGGFVGLGFAIPSNTVVKIVSQLRHSGKVSLDFDPGFQVRPITMDMAYKYNLPVIQGVYVYSVNKGGPAYQAGILPGDVLFSIDGQQIFSYTHYQAILREYHRGDTLKLVIARNGKLYQTKMTLRNKVQASGNSH